MAVQRVVEIVYNGYDNTIELQLFIEDEDGKREAELSAVTRLTLNFGETLIDSAVDYGTGTGSGDGHPFNWGLGNGKLVLNLGNIDPVIAVGGYTSTLTVYAPDHSNGILWGTIKTKVI